MKTATEARRATSAVREALKTNMRKEVQEWLDKVVDCEITRVSNNGLSELVIALEETWTMDLHYPIIKQKLNDYGYFCQKNNPTSIYISW